MKLETLARFISIFSLVDVEKIYIKKNKNPKVNKGKFREYNDSKYTLLFLSSIKYLIVSLIVFMFPLSRA